MSVSQIKQKEYSPETIKMPKRNKRGQVNNDKNGKGLRQMIKYADTDGISGSEDSEYVCSLERRLESGIEEECYMRVSLQSPSH